MLLSDQLNKSEIRRTLNLKQSIVLLEVFQFFRSIFGFCEGNRHVVHQQTDKRTVMGCIPKKQLWNEMEDTSIVGLFIEEDLHKVDPSLPDCHANRMILSRCLPIFGYIRWILC